MALASERVARKDAGANPVLRDFFIFKQKINLNNGCGKQLWRVKPTYSPGHRSGDTVRRTAAHSGCGRRRGKHAAVAGTCAFWILFTNILTSIIPLFLRLIIIIYIHNICCHTYISGGSL